MFPYFHNSVNDSSEGIIILGIDHFVSLKNYGHFINSEKQLCILSANL